MTTLDVRLRAEWVKKVGYRYDVLLAGEVIVRRSRDPEYETARVLDAHGLRGKFRMIDFVTGRPRMEFDIERAARLRTIERADRGPPTVGPYRPLSDDVKGLLRPQTLLQGRVNRTTSASGSPKALRRAGGEGGAEGGEDRTSLSVGAELEEA